MARLARRVFAYEARVVATVRRPSSVRHHRQPSTQRIALPTPRHVNVHNFCHTFRGLSIGARTHANQNAFEAEEYDPTDADDDEVNCNFRNTKLAPIFHNGGSGRFNQIASRFINWKRNHKASKKTYDYVLKKMLLDKTKNQFGSYKGVDLIDELAVDHAIESSEMQKLLQKYYDHFLGLPRLEKARDVEELARKFNVSISTVRNPVKD